jgi:hypothetical protein
MGVAGMGWDGMGGDGKAWQEPGGGGSYGTSRSAALTSQRHGQMILQVVPDQPTFCSGGRETPSSTAGPLREIVVVVSVLSV